MRILHIDETFHPLYGYHTTPLVKAESKAGNEVYIITGTWDMKYHVYREFNDVVTEPDKVDAEFEKKYAVTIKRVKIKKYISNRALYSSEIFKVIDEINPDIIYVHLVESIMAIRLLLRKQKYPMIFDSHMLTMASRNKFAKIYGFVYRHFITPKIKKCQHTIVRTQDDDYVNRVLGIPASLTPHVSFGTDTDLFKPCPEEKDEFLKKHNLPQNSFVVVYTGKLTSGKGGLLLAETIKDKFEINGKTPVFLIVGNTVGEYGEKVEALFNQSENKIIRYPVQKYIDLPRFYQCADLCIFPKQCSLSFYDAQGCGLPVLSEDNNVNVDRCSHENGWVFKSGSAADFREKLACVMNMDENSLNKYKDNALQYILDSYSYDVISKQCVDLYNKAIADFNAHR